MQQILLSIPTEQILEEIPAGVLVLKWEEDASESFFRIAYLNKVQAERLGREACQYIGQKLTDVLPHFRSDVVCACTRVLQEQQSEELNSDLPPEAPYSNSRIRIVPLSTHAVAILSEQSSVLQTTADGPLRLQQMVREIEDYAIVLLDAAGIILSWNQGVQKILGYEATEVIGKNFELFYSSTARELRLPEKLLETAGKRGKIEHSGWGLRKDNVPFWGSTSLTALHHTNGNVIGFTSVTRDLTEQQQAVKALQQAEQKSRTLLETVLQEVYEPFLTQERRFRTLLEAAPDAMVIVNAEGTIQLVNARTEELFGYPRMELIGQPIPVLLADDILQWVLSHPRTTSRVMETTGIHLQKGSFPAQVSLRTIQMEEGVQIVVIIRDISEFKHIQQQIEELNTELEKKVHQRTAELEKLHAELEEMVQLRTRQLMDINQELEAFSYSISHDLRTPLRAIAGYSSRLIEEHTASLNDEGKRIIQVITRNTLRMGQLIDDILALSRLSQTEMQRERLDMKSLFLEIWHTLSRAEEGQRNLNFQLDNLPPATGNRVMLTQAVTNLLSNALKYTRPRSEALIQVGCIQNASETIYFIKDNGVGFDSRYQDKIFDVFQRLHKDSEFEGTGIGLAIVRRVIARHGGKVWCTGAINQGATFYFTLV